MSNSLKQKATKGLMWSSLEQFSVQGIQFIITIIMARILSPSEYGLIGMLSIFLAIAQSLINSGFSQALVRKQDRTEVDFATVFYFNIAISFIIYGLFYLIAPHVAEFYNKPELSSIMRGLCIVIIINAFSIVQTAKFTISIDFKTTAKISLIAVIISGFIGILFALKGYGVWALVFQSLINSFTRGILLWIFSKWVPLLKFSWHSFCELFSFGSKLMLSALIDIIYQNINTIIIGKIFTADILGNYTRAHHFSEFPAANTTYILQRVTYPVLCNIQNDITSLQRIYRRMIKLSAYVIFPMMTGLAAVSYPFIYSTIGEKWIFCAQILQIVCFSMMWFPIHALNLNLLQVKGRSDLFLRLEIVKKIIGIIVLFITVPLGVIAMCYGGIIISLICLIINTYYTGKLIKIGFITQMRDILPTLLLSIIMFIIVKNIIYITPNPVIKLFIGIMTGIICYIGFSYILKFSEFKELISILIKK